MQLNPTLIIDTAISILDSYGLADVTMRRIARSLEVAPGALYWHFPNKQALLAEMGEAIVAPALSPAEPTEMALAVREALTSHTDGAELVGASESLGERIADTLAAAIDAPEPWAKLGGRTLAQFIIGSTYVAQSAARLGALTGEGEVKEELHDAEFRRSIQVILSGLATEQRLG